MKRILFLTCIGSLALTLTAWGVTKGKQATQSGKARSAPTAHAVSAARSSHVKAARTSQSIGPRVPSHSVARASAVRSTRTQHHAATTRTFARNKTAVHREKAVARANTARTSCLEAARIRSAQTAQANARATARTNFAVNRQRNLTFARNVAINRDRNVRIVNYWRTASYRGANYVDFYNYNRVWHDRGWWVNSYPIIAYVYPLGGWWYWNAGYWYPAWGYDPYAYYGYDGPIYGYGDLTPDRIVENEQLALQQQGYYAGSIDGRLGPQTRGALAAFQSDHGLAVTSAVDKPTLQTLGLA